MMFKCCKSIEMAHINMYMTLGTFICCMHEDINAFSLKKMKKL